MINGGLHNVINIYKHSDRIGPRRQSIAEARDGRINQGKPMATGGDGENNGEGY